MELCTNDNCHMREVCARATHRPSEFQSYCFCEPVGAECDGFVLDEHSGFAKDEIKQIREQTGRYDTKTAPLF